MRRMAGMQGVLVPMVTPLFVDGGIDMEGLRGLAEHLLQAPSVDGLFAIGATGEYMRLSPEERCLVIEGLGQVDRRGKLIVVNVGGDDPQEMMRYVESASAARVDAIAAVVPGSIESTPEAICKHFAPLQECGIPLIVYWTPMVKTQKASLEVMEALGRIPSFAGIKDSSRDMEAFAGICAEWGEELSIFQGVEMLHLPSLACGSAGVIGGGLNLYAGMPAEITRLFSGHDLAAAIRLQRQVTVNWEALNRHQSFRWLIKRVWAEQGLIAGIHCRESDEVAIAEAEMDRIRAMVQL